MRNAAALILAWCGLELFWQQLLVGVEDAGVGDDDGSTDMNFLLSLQDAHTWNQTSKCSFSSAAAVWRVHTQRNYTHHKLPWHH